MKKNFYFRFYFICFLAFCLFFKSYANETPNYDNLIKLVDLNNLEKRLIIPPKDNIYIYPNKLQLIDKFTTNPLVEYKNIELLANDFSKNSINELIPKLVNLITNKNIVEQEFNNTISTQFMNIELGTNLDSLLDFNNGLVIRSYLNLLINSQILMLKDVLQKENDTINYLRKLSENIQNYCGYSMENSNILGFDDKFIEYSKVINETKLFDIAYTLHRKIVSNNERLISLDDKIKKAIKTTILHTKYGKIAIGGLGDDVYEGNFIVIIDVGGNDKYNLSKFDNQLAFYSPIRFIVDLDGNDLYQGEDFNIGSGFFGINMIFDFKGDDNYLARNYSIASALFGFGLIEDYAGNDKYFGKDFTIGSGFFGLGILVDYGGNDQYLSESMSQAFSTTKGIGILNDRNGNDEYNSIIRNLTNINQQILSNKFAHSSNVSELVNFENKTSKFLQAVSIGNRATGAGGFSLLLDNVGDDIYSSNSFSQSFSIYNGISMLMDKNGSDVYNSLLSSQASSNYTSFAFMSDYQGDDFYFLPFDLPSNSRNYSLSYLSELDGNDKYYSINFYNKYLYSSYFGDLVGNDLLTKYTFKDICNSLDDNYIASLGYIMSKDNKKFDFINIDSILIDCKFIEFTQNLTNYSANLKSALANLELDTFKISDVVENFETMNEMEQSTLAYYYNNKSSRLEQITETSDLFLNSKIQTISKASSIGLSLNQHFDVNWLLKLINTSILESIKMSLVQKFSELNFSKISNNNLKKSIKNLPLELRKEIYLNLKNNQNTRSLKSKLKYLQRSESNKELKKILDTKK